MRDRQYVLGGAAEVPGREPAVAVTSEHDEVRTELPGKRCDSLGRVPLLQPGVDSNARVFRRLPFDGLEVGCRLAPGNVPSKRVGGVGRVGPVRRLQNVEQRERTVEGPRQGDGLPKRDPCKLRMIYARENAPQATPVDGCPRLRMRCLDAWLRVRCLDALKEGQSGLRLHGQAPALQEACQVGSVPLGSAAMPYLFCSRELPRC